MKIINLAATTDKIQIKLAGNVAATQLDWTCSFYDTTIADGTVLEGVSTGVTNNTTAVDICAAPASGHVRTVKSITVYNADSATAIPIIIFNANGTERVLARNSLTPLASWSTDDMSFYTDISGKVDKSLYDANSILYATTDDTPAALTVGTNTVVGRVAGAITTLAIDSDLSSVSANDDTVPSAKATKAYADGRTPDASDTTKGIIELATAAETTTGTATDRAVTPDGLSGSNYGKRIVQMVLTDDATGITAGDGKGKVFIVPAEMNGWNLVGAHAAVTTVSSSGTPTYQVRNITDSVDMLSTRITIDASEFTSYTAATAPVIDTTKDDVATGDRIVIDKDVAGTGEKGDVVILVFQNP